MYLFGGYGEQGEDALTPRDTRSRPRTLEFYPFLLLSPLHYPAFAVSLPDFSSTPHPLQAPSVTSGPSTPTRSPGPCSPPPSLPSPPPPSSPSAAPPPRHGSAPASSPWRGASGSSAATASRPEVRKADADHLQYPQRGIFCSLAAALARRKARREAPRRGLERMGLRSLIYTQRTPKYYPQVTSATFIAMSRMIHHQPRHLQWAEAVYSCRVLCRHPRLRAYRDEMDEPHPAHGPRRLVRPAHAGLLCSHSLPAYPPFLDDDAGDFTTDHHTGHQQR
jgi:hypothetical protein